MTVVIEKTGQQIRGASRIIRRLRYGLAEGSRRNRRIVHGHRDPIVKLLRIRKRLLDRQGAEKAGHQGEMETKASKADAGGWNWFRVLHRSEESERPVPGTVCQ